MSVEATGLDETREKFNELGVEVKVTTVPEIVLEAGELLSSKAQSYAPVDTGYLRDSIDIVDVGDNYVVVAAQAEYAIFVEEGTSKMDAQPFMAPAKAETESELPSIAEGKVNDTISSIFG